MCKYSGLPVDMYAYIYMNVKTVFELAG